MITSQAPSNHAFNWGMVLTHELAHVFAIQLSRSRVPRWFTEGLSELETARLRPEWTRHDDAALYGACGAGELPPLVVAVERVRDRARRRGGARLRARGGGGRLSRAPLRLPGAARRRWRRSAAASATPSCSSKMAGTVGGRAGARVSRRARRAASRATTSSICRRSRASLRGRPARRAGHRAQLGRSGPGALRAADLDEAKKALDRARALPQPSADDQADALFLAGEIALAQRDADAAVAAFEGLLDAGAPPRDGYEVRVRLALAEIKRKHAAAAEAHLRRAIELDPIARRAARPARGDVQATRSASPIGSRSSRRRCASTRRRDRVAKEAVLGAAKAGRSARVTELGPIAIFIDPANPDLHAALGRALAATGKAAAGAAAFERALVFGPQSPALLHLELADPLRHARRPEPRRRPPRRRRQRRSLTLTGRPRRSASVSVKVVPSPGALSTSIWPP